MIGPIIVGLVLVALFVLHALRARRPLLNVRLYKKPTFSTASIAMFFVAAALFGGMILLPLYWQSVRHESVIVTGLLTAPQGIGAAMMMPVAGRLTDRFGGGPLTLFGVLLTAVGDGPVRADRPAHLDRLPVRGDGDPRFRDRLCVHAGDVGRVRVAVT